VHTMAAIGGGGASAEQCGINFVQSLMAEMVSMRGQIAAASASQRTLEDRVSTLAGRLLAAEQELAQQSARAEAGEARAAAFESQLRQLQHPREPQAAPSQTQVPNGYPPGPSPVALASAPPATPMEPVNGAAPHRAKAAPPSVPQPSDGGAPPLRAAGPGAPAAAEVFAVAAPTLAEASLPTKAAPPSLVTKAAPPSLATKAAPPTKTAPPPAPPAAVPAAAALHDEAAFLQQALQREALKTSEAKGAGQPGGPAPPPQAAAVSSSWAPSPPPPLQPKAEAPSSTRQASATADPWAISDPWSSAPNLRHRPAPAPAAAAAAPSPVGAPAANAANQLPVKAPPARPAAGPATQDLAALPASPSPAARCAEPLPVKAPPASLGSQATPPPVPNGLGSQTPLPAPDLSPATVPQLSKAPPAALLRKAPPPQFSG